MIASLIRYPLIASLIRYPFIDIQMRVRRRPWNWFFNVVFPLFILQGSLVTTYAIDTGLADRAGVTITLLLAIIAFRYVVTEKLPQISYATLIDLYVLSSFVLAALIIGDQTCFGLGLYGEKRDLRVEIASPFDWVEGADGGWTQRQVEIGGPLVHVFLVWVTIHGVIVLAILARAAYFYRDEESWGYSETTLWIGALVPGSISDDGKSDPRLTDEATSALGAFLAHVLDESLPNLSKRCRLSTWTPDAANAVIHNLSRHANGQEGDGYRGTTPFLVATFASASDARKVLAFVAEVLPDDEHEYKEEVLAEDVRLAKPYFRSGVIKVELLDEKYLCLTTRKVLSRKVLEAKGRWRPALLGADAIMQRSITAMSKRVRWGGKAGGEESDRWTGSPLMTPTSVPASDSLRWSSVKPYIED